VKDVATTGREWRTSREDSENAAIAVEAKKNTHNNRETKDGRVHELKGFICDLKDAEISSRNRRVCKCTTNGVK
jgi:hypothetical protein